MPCLQGKEEFEKTQKELLEKGNIMRQGKGQLELQQVSMPSLGWGGGAQQPLWSRASHRPLCHRTVSVRLVDFCVLLSE